MGFFSLKDLMVWFCQGLSQVVCSGAAGSVQVKMTYVVSSVLLKWSEKIQKTVTCWMPRALLCFIWCSLHFLLPHTMTGTCQKCRMSSTSTVKPKGLIQLCFFWPCSFEVLWCTACRATVVLMLSLPCTQWPQWASNVKENGTTFPNSPFSFQNNF